jgi:hypothetical protein
VRLALNVVVQNDEDFVDIVLLYPVGKLHAFHHIEVIVRSPIGVTPLHIFLELYTSPPVA